MSSIHQVSVGHHPSPPTPSPSSTACVSHLDPPSPSPLRFMLTSFCRLRPPDDTNSHHSPRISLLLHTSTRHRPAVCCLTRNDVIVPISSWMPHKWRHPAEDRENL